MKAILETRVVPAATVDDVEAAVPLAEALLAGGLNVLEVTFRTAASAECLKRIAAACPAMYLGAGTLITVEELEKAVASGARFGVSPGLSEDVVKRAAALGFPMVPGVATPTEITQALRLGCTYLKFFPAESLGGVSALRALAGPFAHKGVKFLPTGGIDGSNALTYLALPTVMAVGGSWMVNRDLIAAKRWGEITRLAREAVQLCAAKR